MKTVLSFTQIIVNKLTNDISTVFFFIICRHHSISGKKALNHTQYYSSIKVLIAKINLRLFTAFYEPPTLHFQSNGSPPKKTYPSFYYPWWWIIFHCRITLLHIRYRSTSLPESWMYQFRL